MQRRGWAQRLHATTQGIDPVSELPESLHLAPESEIGIYRIAEAAIAGAAGRSGRPTLA
ncbi:MAG TPA: hypothetical protein VMG40_08420 [Bryobacteraceae bacterium]|nr:hypothetical protein [Bryobacteraceae bacterium]